MTNALITGWGMYAPARVMTNEDLTRLVDTSDEWIVSRTGIRERRIAADDETTTTLSVHAARDALAVAGMAPTELDLVIVGTCSPDYSMPATAVLVAHELGATRAAGFDLMAACSGFVFSLATATAYVRSGMYRNVLVIGVELLSRFLDYTDRNTCVLFGDGAGAVIVSASDQPGGLLGLDMYSDGSGKEGIIFPAGGSACPTTAKTIAEGGHFVHMAGKEVYKYATRQLAESARSALRTPAWPSTTSTSSSSTRRTCGSSRACRTRWASRPTRRTSTSRRYGNTSAASVPMALVEADRRGSHQAGRPPPDGGLRRRLHGRRGGGRMDGRSRARLPGARLADADGPAPAGAGELAEVGV